MNSTGQVWRLCRHTTVPFVMGIPLPSPQIPPQKSLPRLAIPLITSLISLLGNDLNTSIGAVAATKGNIGPGIGKVGPALNFSEIHVVGKWFLSFLMLVGRLELFTVLVLFSPMFWRR